MKKTFDNTDVRILKERRTNRIESILEKSKDLIETSKVYKLKESEKLSNEIYKSIKKYVDKKSINGENSTTYNLELKVSQEDKDGWVRNITDDIREVKLDIASIILKSMKEYLFKEFIEKGTEARQEYLDCVRKLMNLKTKIVSDEVDEEVYEIEKDLIASINYNTKIDELENGVVA